jgi:hypothetical protein
MWLRLKSKSKLVLVNTDNVLEVRPAVDGVTIIFSGVWERTFEDKFNDLYAILCATNATVAQQIAESVLRSAADGTLRNTGQDAG